MDSCTYFPERVHALGAALEWVNSARHVGESESDGEHHGGQHDAEARCDADEPEDAKVVALLDVVDERKASENPERFPRRHGQFMISLSHRKSPGVKGAIDEGSLPERYHQHARRLPRLRVSMVEELEVGVDEHDPERDR